MADSPQHTATEKTHSILKPKPEMRKKKQSKLDLTESGICKLEAVMAKIALGN
jgi:hypothetical protein